MSHAPIIQAQGVNFAYEPASPVLRGVDINADAGSFTCLLGPNGSGKTTMLKCLLGLLKPSSGTILLDGLKLGKRSAAQLARIQAYVPQVPTSAFAFSVQELVLMGRFAHAGVLGLTAKQDCDVARAAMEMTDTLKFASRTLDELSGGEAQCVMIARALAQQPKVLLLDEPTSHLDIQNQLKIYRMMQRLAHDWKMAVVCVSHDLNLAARFADKLVLMKNGKLIAAGSPAEVMQADTLKQAYNVDIKLLEHPQTETPIVWAD